MSRVASHVLATAPVRLGWISFAPVHYYSTLYRLLAADSRLDLTVLYQSRDGLDPYDGGYGQPIVWGADVCSGYRATFAKRATKHTIANPLACHLDLVQAVIGGRFEVLVIFGYNSLTCQLAALAQLWLGRPVIFRDDQNLLEPRPLWKTILKTVWLRRLFSHSFALCVGSQNRRWFAHFGVPEERCYFAPHSVDNQRLQRLASLHSSDRNGLRKRFGLPESGTPVILFVGRLIPKKAPFVLLHAYARVRESVPCALLYVGDGQLRPALEVEAKRLGLTDVHFAGFVGQDEIAAVYAAADMLVLPSVSNETWGLVVNEAMACRLPVITSDHVGCSADLVRDWVNGHVVHAGDVQALADAIGRVAASSCQRARFGAASNQIIQDWTPERTASGVLSAVETAVGPERWSATTASSTL